MKVKQAFFRTVHGRHRHWWIFSVTAVAGFMTGYDLGAVNIALPRIMASFDTSLTIAAWVLLAYLLTTTILLLPAGRLGDIIGRKKVYNLGFLVFAVSAALCGLARDPVQLVLFRVLQGVGASMIQTTGFAITAAAFPDKERGKGLGLGMMTAAIGATSGPSIGGFIVNAVDWRGIFFFSVPVALLGTVMGYLILDEKLISTPSSSRRFDFVGACLGGAAIGALLIGMSLGQEGGWSSWQTRSFLGAAAVAMVAFVWFESRQAHPLVDLGLFKNRTFAFNNSARFVFFLALSNHILLTPFLLQTVMGYSPSRAGLAIAPMNLLLAFISPFVGWLTNKISSRTLSAAGMVIIGMAFVLLSRLDASSTTTDVVLRLLLLGLGYGVFQTPNNTSVMDSVPKEKYGMTSGILSLVRQTGQSLGVALASTIVLATVYPVIGRVSLYSLKRDGAALVQDGATGVFAAGISTAYLVAAGFCALAVVFCLARASTARDRGARL